MKKVLTFLITSSTISVYGQVELKQNPTDFIPKNYVIFEKTIGDLNKDGLEDQILIIKGTDTNQIITDKYRGRLDRNRRGIIVLFNKGGHYELAVENHDCFSSENEPGGVYFAPELSIGINKGNFYVHYYHGRYGNWQYTFGFRNSDFELISYESTYRSSFESNHGANHDIAFDEKYVDLLNKKKIVKELVKVNPEGEETIKETLDDIIVYRLIKLSEIIDFDDLRLRSTYRE